MRTGVAYEERRLTARPCDVFPHILTEIGNFTSSQIKRANLTPINFAQPFVDIMGLYFMARMLDLRTSYEKWQKRAPSGLSSATDAEYDRLASEAWTKGRDVIEEFQALVDKFDDLQQGSYPQITRGTKQIEALSTTHTRQSRTLARGRILEQHFREALQMSTGNLSLQESRKSIQQADAVGRLSGLAFVFIPISLIMSFFGMNILEITGSGVTLWAFLVSLVVLCLLVIGICGWMWKVAKWYRNFSSFVLGRLVLVYLYWYCSD
jgi:hypothetical protein